ncbi:helix-hairpin-helix domain-containing protein [bacterium]|nr:helix-hairpin-helix domain-containing protein [bacterium]
MIKILLVYACLNASILFAQTSYEEQLVEGLNTEEAELMLELLEDLKEHPVNLNTVYKSRLQSLPFIYPFEARGIIENRRQFGPFHNWKSFLKRCSLDPFKWRWLQAYFTIKYSAAKQKHGSFSIFGHSRFPEARAYKIDKYKGNTWQNRIRLKYRHSQRFQLKWSLEKDAGETGMPDHNAGFIEYKIPASSTRLVLGHMQMETGHGMTSWSSYGAYPGANPIIPVLRKSRGLRAYAGNNENNSLRGLGLQWNQAHLRYLFILSEHARDASINEKGNAISWPESGYHRSLSEKEKKDQQKISYIGGSLAWQGNHSLLELSGWKTKYKPAFMPKEKESIDYRWRGTDNHAAGLAAELCIGQMYLNGEYCRTKSGGSGMIATLHRETARLKSVVTIYSATANFHNPYSNILGEAEFKNRKGIYIGFILQHKQKSKISCYAESYRHPWKTATLPSTSHRYRVFIQWHSQLINKFELTFRFQVKKIPGINYINTCYGSIKEMQQQLRYQYQAQCVYRATRTYRFKLKFKYNYLTTPLSVLTEQYRYNSDRGWFVSQELLLKKRSFRFKTLLTRYNTDSYNVRINYFTPALRGQWASVFAYGNGQSIIQTIKYSFKKKLTFGLRVAWSRRLDQDHWGSGIDRINDRDKFELSAAIHYIL